MPCNLMENDPTPIRSSKPALVIENGQEDCAPGWVVDLLPLGHRMFQEIAGHTDRKGIRTIYGALIAPLSLCVVAGRIGYVA